MSGPAADSVVVAGDDQSGENDGNPRNLPEVETSRKSTGVTEEDSDLDIFDLLGGMAAATQEEDGSDKDCDEHADHMPTASEPSPADEVPSNANTGTFDGEETRVTETAAVAGNYTATSATAVAAASYSESATSCPSSGPSHNRKTAKFGAEDLSISHPDLAKKLLSSSRIPDEIASDPDLLRLIELATPGAYNFEIPKIVARILKLNLQVEQRRRRLLTGATAAAGAALSGAKSSPSTTSSFANSQRITNVGLQMPDGLIAWAPGIARILERICGVRTTILGDVTFGACCIDDLTAAAVGVDFLVHFGHSCLIPTDQTAVRTMYVFVDITIDVDHLVSTLVANDFFAGCGPAAAVVASSAVASSTKSTDHPDDKSKVLHASLGKTKKLALIGTVQFGPSIVRAAELLKKSVFPDLTQAEFDEIVCLPQVKPLGTTEVLGCTAPALPDVDQVVSVCDGRFHLEAVMIKNPHIQFYSYNPYARTLSTESYGYAEMLRLRGNAVDAVRRMLFVGNHSCLVDLVDGDGVEGVKKGSIEESKSDSSSQKLAVGNSADNRRRRRRGRKPFRFGVILGTLGRQGSVAILERLASRLRGLDIEYFVLLLAEVSPTRLAEFEEAAVVDEGEDDDGSGEGPSTPATTASEEGASGTIGEAVSGTIGEHHVAEEQAPGSSSSSSSSSTTLSRRVDAWIQIACPRLSVDWGHLFSRPLLSTYEAHIVLEELEAACTSENAKEDTVDRGIVGVSSGRNDQDLAPTGESILEESACAREESQQIEVLRRWTRQANNSRTGGEHSGEQVSPNVDKNPNKDDDSGQDQGSGAPHDNDSVAVSKVGVAESPTFVSATPSYGAEIVASLSEAELKLWPRMDYYANAGGEWASYGGTTTSGAKFQHMDVNVAKTHRPQRLF